MFPLCWRAEFNHRATEYTKFHKGEKAILRVALCALCGSVVNKLSVFFGETSDLKRRKQPLLPFIIFTNFLDHGFNVRRDQTGNYYCFTLFRNDTRIVIGINRCELDTFINTCRFT